VCDLLHSGFAMESHQEYRHLLVKLSDSSVAREERRLTVRESLDTVILGTASTSLGVIVAIAVASGMGGYAASGYSDHTGVWGTLAMIGEFLGLAGILLGRIRHGALAPLSILGTIICLSHFVLFFWMRP
jgi:hypothetical protein